MARPPERKRAVFFLGAGFSRAADLPNTAELLGKVHELGRTNTAWGISKEIEKRLSDAYAYFYPDRGTDFRPEVVDCFSMLTAYGQIDRAGLPDGFPDRDLLVDLKFAIAHVLCDGLRKLDDDALLVEHELLDVMVQPGNVIVTTNWDTLVERIATARGVRHRLSGLPSDSELLILKLHGSIDWVLPRKVKKPLGAIAYAQLNELACSERASRSRPTLASPVIRTRVNQAGAVWRTIKGAAEEPFMLTMSPGKANSLDPVLDLWQQAYRSLSSASRLAIVGYSMPPDDLEIRTLLRAGVQRGPNDPEITIRNPAPDVHARIREVILRSAASDYSAVAAIGGR